MKDQNEKGKKKEKSEIKGKRREARGGLWWENGEKLRRCSCFGLCHPCSKVWGLLVFRFKCVDKNIGTGTPGEGWK